MNDITINTDKSYKLLTTFNKHAVKDIQACASISGLQIWIQEEAFRLDTLEPIPDTYTAWYFTDNTIETTKAVERFFWCTSELMAGIRRILIKKGIPEEELTFKELYRGCEKEYWPELYQKKQEQEILEY